MVDVTPNQRFGQVNISSVTNKIDKNLNNTTQYKPKSHFAPQEIKLIQLN